MTKLDYLGGALENFYEDDKLNPHLLPVNITVKENEKIIAHGTAEEIKDSLKSKYNRKIIKWDAYYHVVVLKI